jgi:hypothetical protein
LDDVGAGLDSGTAGLDSKTVGLDSGTAGLDSGTVDKTFSELAPKVSLKPFPAKKENIKLK